MREREKEYNSHNPLGLASAPKATLRCSRSNSSSSGGGGTSTPAPTQIPSFPPIETAAQGRFRDRGSMDVILDLSHIFVGERWE